MESQQHSDQAMAHVFCIQCGVKNATHHMACIGCGMRFADKRSSDREFVIEAKEPNIWWKLAQMWWFVPGKYILKKFIVSGDEITMEMWNGTTHTITGNDFIAKYYIDKGRRTVVIKFLDKRKITIQEISPMYPNGEKDFDRIIEVLQAREAVLSKLLRFMRRVSSLAN